MEIPLTSSKGAAYKKDRGGLQFQEKYEKQNEKLLEGGFNCKVKNNLIRALTCVHTARRSLL